MTHPILMYDGFCGLCAKITRFTLKRDPGGVFRFAAIQSAFAGNHIRAHGREPDDLDTFYVLVDPGEPSEKLLSWGGDVCTEPAGWTVDRRILATGVAPPRPRRWLQPRRQEPLPALRTERLVPASETRMARTVHRSGMSAARVDLDRASHRADGKLNRAPPEESCRWARPPPF